MFTKVGIIGIGVLGSAISEFFKSRVASVICYDKYKNIGSVDDVSACEVVFLCLPTEFDSIRGTYDTSEIDVICESLHLLKFRGLIILKSTVVPYTSRNLASKYPSLHIIHNPEFLSERTALQDFTNQSHIVLGIMEFTPQYLIDSTLAFFKYHFENAEISVCMSYESESMKLFCNSAYAVKIHFMTELKILCDSMNMNYPRISQLMVRNGWINPNHMQIPGHDGLLSYGGRCLPKDSRALLELMRGMGTPSSLLEATIKENEQIRKT
jgi:nucleotide sugar dehydrogenase